jgi:uncharacterized protein
MPKPVLRHALVTGASSGLGREIVRQLVRDRGLTVLATARRLDRLEGLAGELPEGRVVVFHGDLADPDFRGRLWARAEEFPGGLDLLVNNAGVGHYADFADQDPALVRQIMEVNVMALMDLTQRALRHMRPRGSGQVLQVSSVLGYVGLPYSSAYVASKHAVNGLVKSLQYELLGSGVRVWAACPGRTVSEFHGVALGTPETAHRIRSANSEPTDRIVRAILRGLDRRVVFLLPSPSARGVVAAAHWLPAPFEWFMRRWSPGFCRREMEAVRPIRETRAAGEP